ncbi:hypothetical protein PR048_004414 [Dryococelus australis]|uniref:Uncharacterized protein n=1 Tax=Dryococelus australis TaxID=614101 RepID=A0ABQ9I5C4_9NEOP|nr:hypothetical protein PR048_004414 [Dryococelus australis]
MADQNRLVIIVAERDDVFSRRPSLQKQLQSLWTSSCLTGHLADRLLFDTVASRKSSQMVDKKLLDGAANAQERVRHSSRSGAKSGSNISHLRHTSRTNTICGVQPVSTMTLGQVQRDLRSRSCTTGYAALLELREAIPLALTPFTKRERLERASKKQSSDTHKPPYDRVKRCRERKINTKASERVNPMRAIEVIMEQRRNERGGHGRSPRKPADQRHRPARKSGVIRPGIEHGSPWWEASRLTAQPPWPPDWHSDLYTASISEDSMRVHTNAARFSKVTQVIVFVLRERDREGERERGRDRQRGGEGEIDREGERERDRGERATLSGAGSSDTGSGVTSDPTPASSKEGEDECQKRTRLSPSAGIRLTFTARRGIEGASPVPRDEARPGQTSYPDYLRVIPAGSEFKPAPQKVKQELQGEQAPSGASFVVRHKTAL